MDISRSKELVAERPDMTYHDFFELAKSLGRKSLADQSASTAMKRFMDYGEKALASAYA